MQIPAPAVPHLNQHPVCCIGNASEFIQKTWTKILGSIHLKIEKDPYSITGGSLFGEQFKAASGEGNILEMALSLTRRPELTQNNFEWNGK